MKKLNIIFLFFLISCGPKEQVVDLQSFIEQGKKIDLVTSSNLINLDTMQSFMI